MEVYICEKPSQARDLASVLGFSKRADGYIHDGGKKAVTWAFGHLLELYMPDEYDEKWKSWNIDTLPILPGEWKSNVRKTSADQYKVIEGLVKKASLVRIATDLDREGEAIARSLLDRFNYKGTIQRVGLTALDDASIRKALSNIMSSEETINLHYAATARQRADWLVGMNISRLYTVLARQTGFTETLHIGRVLTPLVSLVCTRDREIANFKPLPFWVLKVGVSVQGGQFTAQWIAPEDHSDDQGRCTSQSYAEQVAAQIKGASAVISKAETKLGKEASPLPFDLTSLQQYGNKNWGYTAQQVLDIAQALYDKKYTSYPRVDTRYLPESQREEVTDVLRAIVQTDGSISDLVSGADITKKARMFNDAKVTAHHAIVPTPSKADLSAMSVEERNIYDAIRRHYIAQFYDDYQFNRTQIEVTSQGHLFSASGRTPVKQGWKVLFAAETEADQEEDNSDKPEEQNELPKVGQGEAAQISGTHMQNKMTRPSPHFTESTLLGAMENIGKYVTEAQLKKVLKETAGLGTSATRAGIIEGAVTRGYLKRDKKLFKATEKAHALIAVLPPNIKSPGMTAAWEQELERIADGSGDMNAFMEQITSWINQTVTALKQAAPKLTAKGGAIESAFEAARPEEHECFSCGGVLRRAKGKHGFFWACREDECKKTFPDKRGKPEKRPDETNAPSCAECGGDMRLRKGVKPGQKRATKFWGCTSYPECKGLVAYSKKEHG